MSFSGDNDVTDTILYDVNGSHLAVTSSQVVLSSQPIFLFGGLSGSTARPIRLDSNDALSVTGSVTVDARPNQVSTLTLITASSQTTQFLSADATRRGACVYNDANKPLFLRLGVSASYANFSVKMFRDSYYEVPYAYTGVITGLWENGATGEAKITQVF